MKIGIIAPYNVLSLSDGASIRAFELAKGLNACGASVNVLHHGSTKFLNAGFKFINFKSYCLFPNGGNYLHPFNPSYPSQLETFLRKYNPDVIQCEQPWSIFPTWFFARNFQIPCVLDEHNVEVLWSIHASKIPVLAPYTFIIEKFAVSHSPLILTVSEVDRKYLAQVYGIPEDRFRVIPNGVDLSRFSKMPSSSLLKSRLGFKSENRIVVFHGLLSTKQNIHAANLIIDYVAPQVNDATFLIIGKNPPLWLKAKSKKLRNTLVLGYVPRVEKYIAAADVCIAPILSGSGTRLKLLEYLAAGKPIVSTYKATEGLPIVNKTHALLFEWVNEDFVNAIERSLSDCAFAEKLGSNAKQLAVSFDWTEIVSKLYDQYALLSEEK